jgi:hypothetical protein
LPTNLISRFDVVYNHTTLEHIYDIRKAVSALCQLSGDIVIVIVPFMQMVHWEPESYQDYWRPTPFALVNMFAENGFDIIYLSFNDNPVYDVYLFCIATRNPDKWSSSFPIQEEIMSLGVPGYSWFKSSLP